MTLDFSEVGRLIVSLEKAEARVGRDVSVAVRKSAKDLETDAKTIATTKDVKDTGDLINSISTEFEGDGRSGNMSAIIGPTVDYAIYHEYGTSVLEPREFMGPAFDRQAPVLAQVIGIIGERAID